MSNQKVTLTSDGPLLPGTISKASAKCGKPTCRCSSGKEADLHGPYYRWSGIIDGKLTTKTLSRDLARECERRIENYRKLQNRLDEILKDAISKAPWLNAKFTKPTRS